MGGDMWNPALAFNAKEVVFVFVETETDMIGVGEIWSFYGSTRRGGGYNQPRFRSFG